jgi:signal transduction histidine kinase
MAESDVPAARDALEARRRHDRKDELLRALSHDLRSPLGSLLVWLELLRGQELDPSATRVVGKIEAGVRDVRDMVLRFLEMSQILSGTLPLEIAATDPASAVDAAVEAAKVSADAKGVEIVSALDRSLPPIPADARCLRHALAGLIASAVQSTPAGGLVQVSVERGDDRVAFHVRDAGPGLGGAEAAALAEDLAAGLTPGVGGLRLAVAAAVARLHGGSLRATSERDGGGAVFTLELPIAASPAIGRPRAS